MPFSGSANLPIVNRVTAHRSLKHEVNYLKCWTNMKTKILHKMCSLSIRGHCIWTLADEELKGNKKANSLSPFSEIWLQGI